MKRAMSSWRRRSVFAVSAGLLALLVVAHLLPAGRDTLLVRELFNLGHVWVYGGAALVWLAWRRRHRRALAARDFLVVGIGMVGLGVALEALQIAGPRDASLGDVVFDAAGVLVAFLVAVSFDARTVSGSTRRPRRWMFLSLAALLLAATMLPLARTSWFYWQQARQFPLLYGFDEDWERSFLGARDAQIRLVPAPSAWQRTGAGHAARVTFYPANYPSLHLEEPRGDWRGWRSLALDVYAEQDQPPDLHVRIDDRWHDQTYDDRFTGRISLRRGFQRVRVDLDEVRSAPRTRELDMSAITDVILFLVEPPAPVTLWVDNIRLEGPE
ncbi:MAG: hypothetical protein JSV80_15060 [Acidobacteriota bacterium]|nr:MAG: hypothetical protein JSV80_15060 [Acidobacteriota bacterium]